MLRFVLVLAFIGLPIAAAAEPVAMSCKGSRTSTDNATGALTTRDIAFQVEMDSASRTVVQDGKTMVVRDWSKQRIVYSDFNPGILGALANGAVTTLNLATGAWRDQKGSGTCKPAPSR